MKYLFFLWILPFMIIMQTQNTVEFEPTMKKESSGLHYLVREQKDTTKSAPVLILLHGYGSNENDLFSLSSQIPDNWLVLSVRAPIRLGSNQFKWYNVKLVNEKITMNFEDEEKSRQLLLKLIDEISIKYKIDKNKIVTAGFSQGANMALGLALTEPEKILAAGCFSGRFMEEIKPLIKDKKALKAKQIFITHGTKDKMLPLRYAKENQAILEAFGMEVTLSTDNVAHSISRKQLNEFVKWMKKLF
jgi:phospholipase/carboxylesterase